MDPPGMGTLGKPVSSLALIRSTAPNPNFKIGVKNAAQYQPLPTGPGPALLID